MYLLAMQLHTSIESVIRELKLDRTMYVIQDTRQYVGNSVLWWGPESSGYTTNIDEAGRYTLDEAKKCACRETDLVFLAADVEAMVVRHVRFDTSKGRPTKVSW